MSIEGYRLTLGIEDYWRFERGHFIKQLDSFNCGPIACVKILEMFHLTTKYEVNLAVQIIFAAWLQMNGENSYNDRNRTSLCV